MNRDGAILNLVPEMVILGVDVARARTHVRILDT